jgi:hypothetical protein
MQCRHLAVAAEARVELACLPVGDRHRARLARLAASVQTLKTSHNPAWQEYGAGRTEIQDAQAVGNGVRSLCACDANGANEAKAPTLLVLLTKTSARAAERRWRVRAFGERAGVMPESPQRLRVFRPL